MEDEIEALQVEQLTLAEKKSSVTTELFFVIRSGVLMFAWHKDIINNKNKRGVQKGMHQIYFYKDRKGKRPVADYLIELASKTDKSSQMKLKKYNDYIQALSEFGTLLGEPYLKHIEGELWELRPMHDRAFFVSWTNGSFVLLHCFVKKTQKTPKREIERAKRELKDLKERGIEDE